MPVDRQALVAVLMGGLSSEREISLKSGRAVLDALRARGWRAEGVDAGTDLPERLHALGARAAWIALHGRFGEDGCVQGLLELMRIPYTGSGVRASAVAMDKITTRRLVESAGVPVARGAVWRRGDPLPGGLRYPVMAKVPEGGSTIGVRRCEDAAELDRALAELPEDGEPMLVEEFVEGDEITVAVLEGRPLPVVAIRPASGFFDFEAKYTKGYTRYEVPAPLPEEAARAASAHALRCWSLLGLSGVVRADFIVTPRGEPIFLEVNTVPGMTATSLVPMAAGAVGIGFEELVERLLLSATLHRRVDGESP